MDDTKIRQNLIEFIRVNDSDFANIDFSNYSLTVLTIIKTRIETRIANKNTIKRGEPTGLPDLHITRTFG